MRSFLIYGSLVLAGFEIGVHAQCSTTGRLALNATATRTAAATVPSCSIFTGEVLVYNTSEVNLDGWETIDGDLEIFQYLSNDETYVHSKTLRNISGHLQIRGSTYFSSSAKLGNVNISFPALEYVGQVNVGGNYGGIYKGVSITLGQNTTTEAVHMGGVQGLGGLRYNTLFLNVSTVRDFIPSAVRTGDEGEIKNNEAKDFFSTVSSFNSSVTIKNNGFASIVMPQLESVRGMTITGNQDLKTINLAAVKAGYLQVSENGRETGMVLDRLTSLTGGTTFSTSFANLVSLKIPQLREMNSSSSYVAFWYNLFSELHFTNLQQANTTLDIRNNSVLIDLTMPRLLSAKRLDIRYNPRLLNFTANVLKRVEAVQLEGNFTNVEFFSLTEVTGDFKVIGSPSMDCSWFDENLFQKVVKGGYQCIGNHTKPLVPRKPSTPTNIEDVAPAPDPTPSGKPTENKDGGGLSTGAKAGIGAGVAAGVVLLLGIGGFLWWKRKKASAEVSDSRGGETAELGSNEVKVASDVREVKEDETMSPVPRELDAKSGGLTETKHELDSEGKKESGWDTTKRSELP